MNVKKWTIPPVVGLVVGVLAVSTASTFIRLAQAAMSSLALAAWRLTLASLFLAPLALARKREAWVKLSGRDWALLLASGLFLALHFYTWILSLEMTSVAVSVVLVSTAPLFVALLSTLFLDEPITVCMMIGIVIAMLGSTIIGVGDAEGETHRLLGDVLALLGALTVGCYMLIGRRQRVSLSLLGYIFPVYATAAVALMLAAWITGVKLRGYPAQIWLWLVLTALIPQILGHSSFNWALGHLPATYVSLAVLAEPIGSTLLAWWVLREPPGTAALIGGPLILLGIVVATWRPRQGLKSEK